MGTNYYVVPNRPSIEEPIHIGKSSYGWLFLFHEVYEPYNDIPVVWSSYPEVKGWLWKYTVDEPKYVIINEYDVIVSFDDFINLVEQKQKQFKDNLDNFDHATNVDGYRFTKGEFC